MEGKSIVHQYGRRDVTCVSDVISREFLHGPESKTMRRSRSKETGSMYLFSHSGIEKMYLSVTANK